jgi:hypothetical protein
MEWIALFLRRSWCWCEFIGRQGYGEGFWDRIGPITAWRVACAIHPWEDIGKWWLRTGHIKVGPRKFWTVY